MSDPVLYGYFRSSATWRVRLGLHLKGLAFEYRPVNLLKGEQRADDYLRVNPMGAVPSLVVDGRVLTESLAILHFLDETHPAPPLLPADPFLRARVRALAEHVNSEMQPFQTPRAMNKLDALGKVGEEGKKTWAAWFNAEGLRTLETLVGETAGLCCAGDEVTLADLCLVPQLYGARRFGVDLAPFPTLTRIEAHLAALPAFVKSHPSQQPDCPPELR